MDTSNAIKGLGRFAPTAGLKAPSLALVTGLLVLGLTIAALWVWAPSRHVGSTALVQAFGLLLALAGLWWWRRAQSLEHQRMQALHAQLTRARDLAEAAGLAKTRFLAHMHDALRPPVNGLQGMVQQVAQTDLSPAQREQLSTAHQSTRHLLNLLNDFLDLSTLDPSQPRIDPEPVQMRLLVNEVLQWMQVQADDQHQTLKVYMDRDCPPWVLTDPSRVRQILLNLVSHALQLSEQGGVRVDVRCRPGAAGEVIWRVDVRDTGHGTDDASPSRQSQRVPGPEAMQTRHPGGTGLGLEMACMLARHMAGDITAHSLSGEGPRFALQLPTRVCDAPVRPLPAQPRPDTATAPAHPAWHVLVAEDHPVNRKVLGIILRDLGHRVSFAEDGAQALAMAREQDFDLVLMDIHMPHMNGLDSARAIRALPGERAHTPIIAITADVMNAAQERSLKAGMDDFIAKPIDPRQLQAVMTACKARAHDTVPA